MRRTLTFALCAFVLLTGCNPTSLSDATDFRRFEGNIVASWAENGRDMILKDSFRYIDGSNREWIAPPDSVVNGASIPAAFWSVIGGPFEGKYRNASVVHDVGCDEMRASWEDVHRMFYEACRCGGVDDRPETEEAVIARVRDHVEHQTGELRPAVYTVQPGHNSYRVDVQYVHKDEQGQVVADPGCTSTAIVSSEGKLVK